MNNDICCPYCRKPQEINHDDGYGYHEEESYYQTCYSCGEIFVYTTIVYYAYEVSKARVFDDSIGFTSRNSTVYPNDNAILKDRRDKK